MVRQAPLLLPAVSLEVAALAIGAGRFEGYAGCDVHVRGQRLVERGQDRIGIGLC